MKSRTKRLIDLTAIIQRTTGVESEETVKLEDCIEIDASSIKLAEALDSEGYRKVIFTKDNLKKTAIKIKNKAISVVEKCKNHIKLKKEGEQE